jgi:hypothetical protein
MSEAIGALLSDPTRAATMGAVGRQRVRERFSAEQFRSNVLSVLNL